MQRTTATIAGLALAAGALLGAGAAHADNTDDAFIQTLTQRGQVKGYTVGVTKTIVMAHWVCWQVDDGASPGDAAAALADENSESRFNDWAYVVGASIAAYCPWNLDVPFYS